MLKGIGVRPSLKAPKPPKKSKESQLESKLSRIKTLVIECDSDNRVPQPYEILDIINE